MMPKHAFKPAFLLSISVIQHAGKPPKLDTLKPLKIRILKSRSAFRVAGLDYSGDKTGDTTAISGMIISL